MNEESHVNGQSPKKRLREKGFPTEATRASGNRNTPGRPSIRSNELEEIILSRMREGESLIGICDDPDLPCRDTVFAWLAADEERKAAKKVSEGEVLFSEKYAIAARIRTAAMAEEILSIADDGRNDTYKDADGKTCVDYDHIQRSKLRVDARKWLMAKLEPKKYGERPGDIHVTSNVSGFVVLTADRLKELQQQRAEALAGVGQGG